MGQTPATYIWTRSIWVIWFILKPQSHWHYFYLSTASTMCDDYSMMRFCYLLLLIAMMNKFTENNSSRCIFMFLYVLSLKLTCYRLFIKQFYVLKVKVNSRKKNAFLRPLSVWVIFSYHAIFFLKLSYES